MNSREDAVASIERRRAIDDPIHGIWAITTAMDPHNRASQAVCQRLGMTHLGQTTMYYNTPNELFGKLAS